MALNTTPTTGIMGSRTWVRTTDELLVLAIETATDVTAQAGMAAVASPTVIDYTPTNAAQDLALAVTFSAFDKKKK